MNEDKEYEYLGIQALPPRKSGRDRRRLNKAFNIPDEPEHVEITETVADEIVIDDPFSPYVEEIPQDLTYSDNREINFEFLDNTADIQVHSWGTTINEAVEQCVLGMFGYMTELSSVDINLDYTPIVVKARGHDCLSLLYDVLNEFLCSNNTMELLIKDVRVITPLDGSDFSNIRLLGFGERYDSLKHTQGTEIKAVTYSNMQVRIREDLTHIYVILDICVVC